MSLGKRNKMRGVRGSWLVRRGRMIGDKIREGCRKK
jgi:hypothetical protein